MSKFLRTVSYDAMLPRRQPVVKAAVTDAANTVTLSSMSLGSASSVGTLDDPDRLVKEPRPHGLTTGFTAQRAFEAFKYTWSVLLLLLALALVLWGIGIGTTHFFVGSPVWLNYVLLVVFISLLAPLQGTMIALSQLRKASPSLTGHKTTEKNLRLALQPDRLERFLMGRQICVVILMFMLARLTTIEYLPGLGDVFTTVFLSSGLFGSFVVLIIGYLVPQILGARFPVQFLNFPHINLVIRLCLLIRWTGLPHASWLCVRVLTKIFRLPFHAVEVGREDRANGAKPPEPVPCRGDSLCVTLASSPNAHSDYITSQMLCANASAFCLPLANLPRQVEQILARNADHVLAPEAQHASKVFSTPDEVASIFAQAGEPVPAFLLPRDDPNAEPAYIAALRLMVERDRLQTAKAGAGGRFQQTPTSNNDLEMGRESAPPRPTPLLVSLLSPIIAEADLAHLKSP